MLGVAFCESESLGPRVPYRSEGKPADMGERAFGLKPSFEGESWFSNPRPTDCGCVDPSSGGGVGVRGGRGTGISDAMVECERMDQRGQLFYVNIMVRQRDGG